MTLLDLNLMLGLVDIDLEVGLISVDLDINPGALATDDGDRIAGSTNGDVILALLGDDIIIGSDGVDVVEGGTGYDTLVFDFAGDRHVDSGAARDLTVTATTAYTDEGLLPLLSDVYTTFTGIDRVVARFGQTIGGEVFDFNDDSANASGFLGAGGVQFISGGGTDAFVGSMSADTFVFTLGSGTMTQGTAAGGGGEDTALIRLDLGTTQNVVFAPGEPATVTSSTGETVTLSSIEIVSFAAVDLVGAGTGETVTLDASAAEGQILADFTNGGARADYLADLVVTTGSGNDFIQTGAGDDIIDGGAGRDAMSGGDGDDTYYVDMQIDRVFEEADGGYDRVITSVNLAASAVAFANVERFELAGGATQLRGNSFDNVLVANDTLDSVLIGFAGDDTLIGGSGNDFLRGDAGADTMAGGAGDDVYRVDQAGDVVTENANEGTDHVFSSISYTLTDNVENLTLFGAGAVSGTGNALDNTIRAGSAPATLSGLAGNDELIGSASGDTLIGGDGDDALYGRMGEDAIFGGAGNDVAFGGDQNDALYGEAGDDVLRGEAGRDMLAGGDGNDRLFGGIQSDELLGGAGSDILRGEDGNDTIDGGADLDQIFGGAGRDTLTGGAGEDLFFFADGDTGSTLETADIITDFSQADGDTIRLNMMDAVAGGSDDEFTFIGDAAFSGTAGELRFEQGANYTLVLGDTDGDGVADMAIRLDGQVDLVMTDFVL